MFSYNIFYYSLLGFLSISFSYNENKLLMDPITIYSILSVARNSKISDNDQPVEHIIIKLTTSNKTDLNQFFYIKSFELLYIVRTKQEVLGSLSDSKVTNKVGHYLDYEDISDILDKFSNGQLKNKIKPIMITNKEVSFLAAIKSKNKYNINALEKKTNKIELDIFNENKTLDGFKPESVLIGTNFINQSTKDILKFDFLLYGIILSNILNNNELGLFLWPFDSLQKSSKFHISGFEFINKTIIDKSYYKTIQVVDGKFSQMKEYKKVKGSKGKLNFHISHVEQNKMINSLNSIFNDNFQNNYINKNEKNEVRLISFNFFDKERMQFDDVYIFSKEKLERDNLKINFPIVMTDMNLINEHQILYMRLFGLSEINGNMNISHCANVTENIQIDNSSNHNKYKIASFVVLGIILCILSGYSFYKCSRVIQKRMKMNSNVLKVNLRKIRKC